MVVGEATNVTANNQVPKAPGVSQDKIDNIMGGISNTGAVKMNNHRKKLRQRFDIIKKLGQGTYGKVQLGINKETGQEVAIKTIKKCKIEAEADLIRIRREVQIMSSVQHPNIIHIYEVFENREKMVLVMEFAAGGELYDYLSERKVLAEEEARRIFRQVSTAVYYCHKHKICHRDLKLENILLDENGNAKIADFGLSNVFDEQRLLATFCGSPLYASPEIVKGTPYQGPEVDCWSLGVLLYTLVYGSMPFDGSNFKRLVKQISQGDYYEPKKPSRASPLIRDMLTVSPQKRATIEQICNHWWVNEGYKGSCLDLAEDLANQTPVRLDVLLSLSPTAVTADQLVVPSADSKANERVPRSHSVGSIRDIGNTEAERRILDMVAAGGEAALMPSPTRTITPAHSPIQSKRKLEKTVSTENAIGAKKKEKPTEKVENSLSKRSIAEMDVDPDTETQAGDIPMEDLEKVENICEELIGETASSATAADDKPIVKQKTLTKLDSVEEAEETGEEINPTKVIKKFVNKHKTADLVAAVSKISPEKHEESSKKSAAEPTRKNSLTDENTSGKLTERRRSRILETAERFQNMGNANNEKPKKIVIPGVSVGSFKKEFERKASLTEGSLSAAEKRALEKKAKSAEQSPDKISLSEQDQSPSPEEKVASADQSEKLENSDSKNSLANFSLEEARRSMENSIALLNQAKNESSKEVDQLCAKTENVAVSEGKHDREKKLKNAREIIGNAIQPGGRLCMGVRKPPVPFGINGRSISGGVVLPINTEKRPTRQTVSETSTPEQRVFEREPLSVPIAAAPPPPEDTQQSGAVKTSRAEITLKSATLPRRKTAKTEIQLDIKPKIVEQPMRFSTEMQHQVPDLRSAPVREAPYSPITNTIHQRATSLEPQTKEHIIPIQRPPNYTRTGSNSIRSGSLSRQSTNESESDTNLSQSTIPGSSQPIKKSPREFIIPIAVEGGGFITPRSGSLEPTESSHTTSSTFSRIGKPRRMGSLLTEADSEDESPFQKMRTSSINREGDGDEPRFTLHRLRSTRPTKKLSQDTNDSQSSGEDDDEDGFEILTAENLFSTLLQRVRALTNRLNVNNDITSGFPNSRLLNNMRQTHSPFWNQEPFGSRLNNATGAPWRRSFSRELGSDMDSMFSRTGATLPRGKNKIKNRQIISDKDGSVINDGVKEVEEVEEEAALDLADLDLSRLRLTKKDLETLSTITPGLPKCFQEQLLAKLPPTQARKLSRTLSMQNNALTVPVKVYKRSQSGGREMTKNNSSSSSNNNNKIVNDNKPLITIETPKEKEALPTKQSDSSRDESSDRSSILYRRSTSRGRCDYDTGTDSKSRSTSVCKTSDDCNNRSLCSSYSSDVSDKYKYYSPYLSKKGDKNDNECSILLSSSSKVYDSAQRNSCLSPTKDCYGRPPSGCLSPPPPTPDNSLRRRSSQRRISRFLRPDFFDQPREENAYLREKREREKETQNVLREIREKSRERSRDRRNHNIIPDQDNRTDGYLVQNKDIVTEPSSSTMLNIRHVRNKSLERFCDPTDAEREIPQIRRRSLSRTRDLPNEKCEYLDKNVIADKILQELQILSAAKVKQEEMKKAGLKKAEKENSATNKSKSREKSESNDSSVDGAKSNTSTSTTTTTITKKVTKIKKVKKSESKDSNNKDTAQLQCGNPEIIKIVELEKPKKESKLIRPKSYPSKEPEKSTLPISSGNDDGTTPSDPGDTIKSADSDIKDFKISRPKSFPSSKLTQPKEVKKSNRSSAAISAVVDKLMEKSDKSNQLTIGNNIKINVIDAKSSSSSKNSDSSSADTKAPVKKIIKVVKKIKPEQQVEQQKQPEKSEKQLETPPSNIPQPKEKSPKEKSPKEKSPKEKSPEKKPGKGLLYVIGQKFEKLRENAKSKEKKTAVQNQEQSTVEQEKPTIKVTEPTEKSEKGKNGLKKKKTKTATTSAESATAVAAADEKKADKKSRIDAMIRSLRDRSVTRAPVMTESGLIKRAVSVEDISGVFNKSGVNKVLGLFKKFEKDASERKVMNTRSTSNIERQIKDSIIQKDRPKSGGFVSTLRKCKEKESTPTNNVNTKDKRSEVNKSSMPANISPSIPNKCPDCGQEKETIVPAKNVEVEIKPPNTCNDVTVKNKRKELTLDLSRLDNNSSKHRNYYNGNLINNYSSLPYGSYNNNNNNNFHIGLNEINQNSLLTPSNENIANYSSDSRSPHDDCASSSTFLSPSDEPELCFDNWSVCSEDNFISTPSPTVSRLSRASQFSSPTTTAHDSQPESVIDRIKRKSFYCRFNEKKPKRQSSIVGPAARDYYRESAAKLRSRPPDRVISPDLEPIRSSHEYFKPLKLSSVSSDLKPPHYKSNVVDYSKPRKSLNDIYPPPISTKRYVDTDYNRSRNSGFESSSPSYYNTYSPQRRSSFTLNGILPSAASNNIDGYATLGRRLRSYDHRSLTTLDPSQSSTNISSNVGTLRRSNQQTPTDFGNLPRPNLHYRNSSVSRSPTNI